MSARGSEMHQITGQATPWTALAAMDPRGVLPLLVMISANVLLWLWIGLRGITASAWGTSGSEVGPAAVALLEEQPGEAPYQLRAGGCASLAVALMAVLPLQVLLHDSPASQYFELVVSYCLCWFPEMALLAFAWFRVGLPNDVQIGLLASFFISGSVLGLIFALFFEAFEIALWKRVWPGCFMQVEPMTLECNAHAALVWILAVGLVEETGKGIWLFYRFRRRLEDVPSRCCCWMFPSSTGQCCRCWYKLASTPYHVVLGALAAGAGFECVENAAYVFSPKSSAEAEPMGKLSVAVARMGTSTLHMVWTGLIGWGLARRLFCPREQQPSLPAVILPSVLLHGLFDYSIAALSSLEAAQTALICCFLLLCQVTALWGYCALACHTGARCRCRGGGCSCCCAPGFWEERFLPRVSLPPPPVTYTGAGPLGGP